MRITKYIPLLLLMMAAVFTASCGGSEDPQPQEEPAPVLLNTSPENGAGGFIENSLSIVFTYDQNIRCTAQGKAGISVDGGASVASVSAYSTDLTVEVSRLSRGSKYTVTIPAGAVEGYRTNQKPAEAVTFSFSTKEEEPVPVDPEDPKDWENAASAARNMGAGWNLGNTLDSNSGDVNHMWIEGGARTTADYERAWGQPLATRALIHMFKEAGFKSIRVPVTWYPHVGTLTVKSKLLDDNNYHYVLDSWTGTEIDPVWMARVKEVVNYVIDEGMYCILNVHHDTGSASTAWLRADEKVYAAVRDKYCELWRQIATEFESYGPRLIFESFNEMLDANSTWNHSTDAAHEVINKYNADFVATVRATGGKNAYRNLILNTYAARCDEVALKAFRLPQDTVEGKLLAEVHSYAPYHFAFDTDHPKTEFDASCETEVTAIIERLNTYLVSKGIPCVLGEYGADSQKRSEAELVKQARCYVSNAAKYDIPCLYWMTLSNGEDRTVPKWTKPLLKDAILKAYNDNKTN